MMPTASTHEPPTAAAVVQQHADETALLRHVRSVQVRAPHVGLLQLGRLDERLAAHLDGLSIAGARGSARCLAALEQPGAGEVFTVAVQALQTRDARLLEHVLALVPAVPQAHQGLTSALGWVSSSELKGVVSQLLGSPLPERRALGLTACRMHRVDPGPSLASALAQRDAGLRAAALRAAGALGRVDLLGTVRQAIGDEHPDVVLQAAIAASLLGERRATQPVLQAAAMQQGPLADLALALALTAPEAAVADDFARQLSQAAQAQPADKARRRRLIRALGWLGDARFVPWLIERMDDPDLSRLAGESFCWITGADLAAQNLDARPAPEHAPDIEHDTDDSTDDETAALGEDDDLPWPDVARIRAWWATQSTMHAAAASHQRLFEGQPPSGAHATDILRHGTQRRRAQAARWICVLSPGEHLFPVASPTPRQRRWLAQARVQ